MYVQVCKTCVHWYLYEDIHMHVCETHSRKRKKRKEKKRKEKKRKGRRLKGRKENAKMKTRERKAILVVDLGSKRKRRERRYRDLCTILISWHSCAIFTKIIGCMHKSRTFPTFPFSIIFPSQVGSEHHWWNELHASLDLQCDGERDRVEAMLPCYCYYCRCFFSLPSLLSSLSSLFSIKICQMTRCIKMISWQHVCCACLRYLQR